MKSIFIRIAKKHLLKTFLCLFLGLTVFRFPNHVNAQSISLSISPPYLEIMIKPGKSATQTYILQNNGETTIITPSLAEYSLSNIVIESDTSEIPKWINISNPDLEFDKSFVLKSGEEKQINLKISPPEKIEEKDYYHTLLFTSNPVENENSSASSISSSIGSILLINVTSSGMPKLSAQITKIQLPLLIDSFSELKPIINIKNTGQTYFRPTGKIILKGPFVNKEYDISRNIIMSGQTKVLSIYEENNKNQSSGFQAFSFEKKGFLLGKYSLQILFTINESNISVEKEKIFFAFPWKISLVILAIIMFLYIIKRKKLSKNNNNSNSRKK